MKKLFTNTWFHRTIYLFLLLGWTVELANKISCPFCISSIGISYFLLYFPVALLLVGQILLDKWLIWLLFFLCSISIFRIMLFNLYDADKYFPEAKGKVPDLPKAIHLFTLAVPCLAYLMLLLAIMP